MDKYKDASLPIKERVEDLLSKMTLEEKVAQLCGDLVPTVIVNGEVSKEGFRVIIVLPKDTNTEKPKITEKNLEDKLLWARNKWLIAHADSNEAKQGAFVGLTGINIDLAKNK